MTAQPTAQPVLLSPHACLSDGVSETETSGLLVDVGARAASLAGSPVREVLAWAARLGEVVPHPASGRSRLRWEVLATLGAADLTVARVVEPHLDAVSILHEHGEVAPEGSTWGVYAAEGPPPRLESSGSGEVARLSGRKPWCSLAGEVSHALVTAWVEPTRRGLFAVDLSQPGVGVADGTWAPRGLVAVVSTALDLDRAEARPVGGPGWYLERAGFAWGGIGVAAVWYGAAVALARRLHAQLAVREPDQVALMHLGVVDAALAAARAVLREAAEVVDADADAATSVSGHDASLLAARARTVVATSAETVLAEVGHALGPGPLTQEPEHAARVADLTLYLRQHHAARDAAATGRLLSEGRDSRESSTTGAPW